MDALPDTLAATDAELGEEPLFGSMGDYGDFDHSFFGMHQKLAYWTDPAARLCIERSFEAIIDAGMYLPPSAPDHAWGCVTDVTRAD